MKTFSIFARPHFFGIEPDISNKPFLHRGAAIMRGKQVAQFLGAKYNPKRGFDDDICIYVKPKTLDKVRDGDYVDVGDSGEYLVKLLEKRPKIKLIALSQNLYDYLKKRLKNELFFIPEHHCNFERIRRIRNKITTAGFIGSPTLLNFSANEKIKKALKRIGLKFIAYYFYKTRLDVVNFYKKIDLQIVGRFNWTDDSPGFRDPTKIINAASFGIPTIARPIPGYKGFEGNYIPVDNMKEMLIAAKKMKDNNYYYKKVSKKILLASMPYHIEKTIKLYKKLV